MAVLKFLALLFLSLACLSSPARSITCTSQNVTDTNKSLFLNCTDLPTLNSFLHYTYNAAKSSLSIAFIAPPVKSNGWIAWGLNPTSDGMIGAQTLIAFKDSNGSMTVKTYNISSYRSIVESKLSFGVADSRAEYSGGTMKIFATLALPENMTEVNHVWQVGSSVTAGVPDKHEFSPANLNAKGKLEVVVKVEKNGTTGGGSTIAPSSANSNASNELGPSAAKSGADSVLKARSVGVYLILLFLGSFSFFALNY